MNLKYKLSKASKRTLLIGLMASVILLTMLINIGLKGLRIDLTSDSQYTLSSGTHNIIDGLETPITLQFFFSDKLTKDIPTLRHYAKRVQELLEEYELLARGNIKLEVIDPEPFSENEDKAAELGLQAVPVTAAGSQIYFGLAGINESGNTNIIEFFHANKEEFLEYDISQLIYKTAQSQEPKLGLISSLDIRGSFNPLTRQPVPAWMAWTQIEESIQTQTLGTDFDSISDDIHTLLIIHPKELSEQSLYAIDQFALRGGNILVFVDPLAESETSPLPSMEENTDKSSNLEKLFSNWGLELVEGKVLADARHAVQVSVGNSRQPVRHLGIQNFGKTNFNREDNIIKDLENINFSSSGVLRPVADAGTTFTPIIQSSTSSMLLDSTRMANLFDPKMLYEGFAPDGETYTVAARISGKISSAFPEAITNTETNKDDKQTNSKTEHLQESSATVNILVFADTDLLGDRLWVRVQNFFGQQIASPFADNGTLLFNAIDQMMGSPDLISIRSRGRHQRPFDKVNDLKRVAESNYRKTEEELRFRLRETETRIQELQSKKEGEDQLILSDEQKREIEKFQQEKLRIRKSLREVQHQLNEDIERLGTRLKLINIALIPALLTIFVLAFNYSQNRKQRKETVT